MRQAEASTSDALLGRKGTRMAGSKYLPDTREAWEASCPQITFTVAGRWWRLFAGVTFKTKRVRWTRFYGHRLLAVRLWGWRVVGIQTRRAYGPLPNAPQDRSTG